MRTLSQGNAADVHAEQTGNDVDGQRQDGHHREQENAAVGLLRGVSRNFFLQQLGPLLKRREVIEDGGKFFRGSAKFLGIAFLEPSWRAIERTKQRARLRRQEAPQPDQHPPQGTQRAALDVHPPCQEIVLDSIHPCRCVPSDLLQYVGLLAQQMRQQRDRRDEPFSGLDGHPQPIDAA